MISKKIVKIFSIMCVLSLCTQISTVSASTLETNESKEKPFTLKLELTKDYIEKVKAKTKSDGNQITIDSNEVKKLVKNKEYLNTLELEGNINIDLSEDNSINNNNPNNKVGSSGFKLVGVDLDINVKENSLETNETNSNNIDILTEQEVKEAKGQNKKIKVILNDIVENSDIMPLLDDVGGVNSRTHVYCKQYLYKYENVSGSGASKQKQNYYRGVIEWGNDLNSGGKVNVNKYDTATNDSIMLGWNQGSQNSHSSTILTTHFNAPYLTTTNFSNWSRISVSSNPTYCVGYKINNWYSTKPMKRAQITAYTGWWYPNNVSDNPSVVFYYNNRYTSIALNSVGFSKDGISFSLSPSQNDDIGQVSGTVPRN